MVWLDFGCCLMGVYGVFCCVFCMGWLMGSLVLMVVG